MSSTLDWDRFDRYAAGECSLEERAELERMLAADPRAAQALSRAAETASAWPDISARSARSDVTGCDANRLWQQIAPAAPKPASNTVPVRRHESPVRHAAPPRRSGRVRSIVVGLGAVVAAAIAGFAVFGSPEVSRRATDDTVATVVTTQPGQRASLMLPDGSSVMLNVASRIEYAPGFGTTHRELFVDGEVLLTVTQHAGKPFIVNTATSSAKVLGTVFSVRQYADDTATTVVVAGGKVGIAETVLTAGDAATADASGLQSLTHGIDVASRLGWETGRLDFVDVTLAEAIPMLQRWYGIAIELQSHALSQQIITTSLRSENAREAIALLATVVHAQPQWFGTTVTLVPLAQ